MNKTLVNTLTLTLALGGGALLAPTDSHADNNTATTIAAGVIEGVLFNEAEKRLLGDYLRDGHYRDDDDGHRKTKKLPPGLKKKLERGGELPPGWQQKVARGEVLDDDLYLHSYSLPGELLHRLPRDIEGTSLRRIDDRIVRIMDATRTVMDVFYLTR